MNKEKEILWKIIDKDKSIFDQINTINFDNMMERILKKYELKRKKLKVRIEYNELYKQWLTFSVGNPLQYEKESAIMQFFTKQEAVDFCTEYGLEIVE